MAGNGNEIVTKQYETKKMNGHLNLVLFHQSTSPVYQVPNDGTYSRNIALRKVMKWLKVIRYKGEVHGGSFRHRASCTLRGTVLSTGMRTCRRCYMVGEFMGAVNVRLNGHGMVKGSRGRVKEQNRGGG